MSDLQATVGRVQLRRLPELLAKRRKLAERYEGVGAYLELRCPRPVPMSVATINPTQFV
ncbi:MAG: DegT/DnrJ/EryC1/StrS family aminotransferase [Pirellulaceae bacterium]